MKIFFYKKFLVLGIIILLSVAAFGASNVPGTSERIEIEQTHEIIKSKKSYMPISTDYPIEKNLNVEISGSKAHVSAYTHDGQIKRLYGEAFSYGESPFKSANAFIQANANLFGLEVSDLEYQNFQPIMYNRETGEYKFTGVNFAQYKNNIPVFRSRLILLVKNEENYPLVYASVDLKNLNGFLADFYQQELNPQDGINNALSMKPSLIDFTQPELVIWAGLDNMIIQPKLAYNFIGDNGYKNGDSSPQKYLFVADAYNGEILYVENLIINVDITGNVQGKATQDKGADFCEDELAEYLMWARVNIGDTVTYADENGNFTIPNEGSSPVTVQSGLRGKWIRVFNQAGSDTILSQTVTPPGPVNFMHNDLNNDEYKRAEVNGYFQANIVRDFTIKYNPDYPGLDQNEFPVNVNINDYCNAYYDYESINFFREGGGCANSAFSTVIHHEYGHHLVALAGSGQGQYGEGMGDVMGILITDNPGLAYGFYGDCDTPMRSGDNDLQYPCAGEIHYCGQLLSGCVWDTRNELNITNPENYTDIISNLAINAMLLHSGTMIDPSITIDYLVLDDDNGNIYDGTPHYQEIAAGFGAHNMDAPPLAYLGFEFPDGLPEIIRPCGGTSLRVVVYNITEHPEPDTGMLYFNDGSGWDEIPMIEVDPNIYDAVFPAGECETQALYYFSAESKNGSIQLWPMGAPDKTYTTVFSYGVEKIMLDDFETDQGWTVENDPYLTAGAWERGIPIGGGLRGDPPTDYDGSGKCYITENVEGNSDVDDGITWLISPTIDLGEYNNAYIEYALWYTNNYGNDPNNDIFNVHITNDNGANWILVKSFGPISEPGWNKYGFMTSDFITSSDQIKVRFEASDLDEGSVVEAGIDAFSVSVFNCTPQCIPSLQCDGTLRWEAVPQGATVTGEFEIGNVGEEGSLLNWKIAEVPDWGTWTYSPSSGTDLESGSWITINVEVVAPENPNKIFTGTIKVVNSEIPYSEFCEIEVYLKTPRSRTSFNFLYLWLFERFPNAFQILRQLFYL
ncbi:MAG: hypothetical protein AYK22_04590 [Thermoplasmatales archaeon SG8-52-3]|nr:MAG: hypothetical protein AYK22_04590 [Thermoplasmatales archaeon SG8-52-3]